MTSFVTLSRVIVVGLCLLGATPNASFAFAFQQSSMVARRGFGKAEPLRGRKAVILHHRSWKSKSMTEYDEELAKLLEKGIRQMTREELDELDKVLDKRSEEFDRILFSDDDDVLPMEEPRSWKVKGMMVWEFLKAYWTVQIQQWLLFFPSSTIASTRR